MSVNLSPLGGAGAQFFTNDGVPLSGGLLYTYQAGSTTPATTYTSGSGITALANPIILDAAGRVPTGEIWLTDGIAYKFVLKDSTDVLIATWDGLSGINSNFIAYSSVEETATATAGQTVFDLSLTYIVGANSLAVFVNGSNQIVNVNYLETDENTVTFITGLNVGDVVKFSTATPVATNAMDAANVSYTPAGAQAVTTNVQAKLRETVSVMDFGATGDGVTDDTAAIVAALAAAKEVFFPSGTYLVSSSITLTTGHRLIGAGPSTGGSTINVSANTIDLFTPSANARNIVIDSLSLNSPTGGTNSAVKASASGLAECIQNNLRILGFNYWINATELYWQNTHTNIRSFCPNSIYIFGTGGGSINNLFENVYIDLSGATANGYQAITLKATKTTRFDKCNFGASATYTGRWIQTTSSNNALTFANCNFEEIAVANADFVFYHSGDTDVEYNACTMVGATKAGATGSLILAQGNTCAVTIVNSSFAQGVNTVDYYLDIQAAAVSLVNSPVFNNSTKINYSANGGVYPPVIQDLSSVNKELESVTYKRIASATNQDFAQKEIFTSYQSTGAVHNLLTFTYTAPIDSGDTAAISGVLTVMFTGRNDAGARTSGFASFYIIYNNDGQTTVTRDAMLSPTGASRTVDITVAQSGTSLQLTITPNLNAISGGEVTSSFKYLHARFASSDISVVYAV